MELRKYFHKLKNQKGYTLAQIPVAAFLMGTLAIGTVNSIDTSDILEKARDARRSADAYQITLALELYNQEHETYPLYTDLHSFESWEVLRQSLEEKYIQKLPKDPDEDITHPYRFWSDGKRAKIFYYSEQEKKMQERWVF